MILFLCATLLLTWQDNSTGEQGFAVWRKDCNPGGQQCSAYKKIFTVAPDSVRFIDTTLQKNRVYCYKVAAVFPPQEYFSNEACNKNP